MLKVQERGRADTSYNVPTFLGSSAVFSSASAQAQDELRSSQVKAASTRDHGRERKSGTSRFVT